MRSLGVIAVAAACATLVSGCQTGRTSQGNINTVSTLFSAKGDPITSPGPQPQKQSTVEAKHANLKLLLEAYYRRMDDAYTLERSRTAANMTPAGYSNALVLYREAGWGAADGVCKYALDLLGESQSQYRFNNRNAKLFSGFGATLMGIFEASSSSLAVFAAGNSLFDAWAQNFEDYAFIAPSVGQLERLVLGAQRELRTASAPTPPTSFADATAQIQTFNRFCLASGMRNLVEDAVAKADLAFSSKTGGVTVIGSVALEDYKQQRNLRDYYSLLDRESRVKKDIERSERKATAWREELRLAKRDVDALQADGGPLAMARASLAQAKSAVDLAPDDASRATADQQRQADAKTVAALESRLLSQQALIASRTADIEQITEAINELKAQEMSLKSALDGLAPAAAGS